uniref:Uncharacterized protein n=1 Tax=Anguilla anguilla TaxID=7936 RepID=A0A0E9SP79_ANGAN
MKDHMRNVSVGQSWCYMQL